MSKFVRTITLFAVVFFSFYFKSAEPVEKELMTFDAEVLVPSKPKKKEFPVEYAIPQQVNDICAIIPGWVL